MGDSKYCRCAGAGGVLGVCSQELCPRGQGQAGACSVGVNVVFHTWNVDPAGRAMPRVKVLFETQNFRDKQRKCRLSEARVLMGGHCAFGCVCFSADFKNHTCTYKYLCFSHTPQHEPTPAGFAARCVGFWFCTCCLDVAQIIQFMVRAGAALAAAVLRGELKGSPVH